MFFYKHLSVGGKLLKIEKELLMYRHHPDCESFSVSRYVCMCSMQTSVMLCCYMYIYTDTFGTSEQETQYKFTCFVLCRLGCPLLRGPQCIETIGKSNIWDLEKWRVPYQRFHCILTMQVYVTCSEKRDHLQKW